MAFGSATSSSAMIIGQVGTQLRGGGYSNDVVYDFWTVGQWHHICLTYDGTYGRLYVDGTQVNYAAKTWNVSLLRAYIGRGVNNSEYWNGTIDDVRVYNTALTATQVAAIATPPPSAPTVLTASSTSLTSVNLSWDDASTNETGFQIERSLTSSSGYSVITTTAANATSYTNSGLTSGTTYYYRIKAVNAGGGSSYAPVASVTTLSLPAPPSGLTTIASSSTAIDLSWTDASANETGFQIERSLTSDTGFSLITTTAANATSYSNTGLTSGTTYYYRVRAVNAGGESAYTTEANATTPSIPSSPSGLIATSASTTSINLAWNDGSTNETGFQIERSLTAGSGFSLITTTVANAISYSNTGLASGTMFYYRIRAVNAVGESAYTSVVNATTQLSTPSAPSGLIATAASPSSINLNWTDASSNETGFQIERSLSSESGFALITTASANAVAHSDGSLTANTTYYYRMRSINANGNSGYTSIVSATTLIAVPAAPTALIASAMSSTSINLSWTDNSSNETEFEIERSETSGNGFALVGTSEANVLVYVDSTLISGITYYYRVRATNSGGASNYTTEVNATTLPLAGGTQLCDNIFCDGNGGVGIGTPTVPAGYKMAVKGKIMAEGVKVALETEWPDYVFEKDYHLADIGALKKYIAENGHLPNLPAAKTVATEGIDVAQINVSLLEKIEELSLYLIKMEERIKILETENKNLKSNKRSGR
jgi:titin